MKVPNYKERQMIVKAVLSEEELESLAYEKAEVTVKVKFGGGTVSYKYAMLPEQDLFEDDEEEA